MRSEPKLATWWTPLGWMRAPEPEAFRGYDASPDDGEYGFLRERGYTGTAFGDAYPGNDYWELQIFTHPEHLLVRFWDLRALPQCRFFVAVADQDAFMVDKLLVLLRDLGLDPSASGRQTRLVKALTESMRPDDDRSGSETLQ
jgi:hypothetical protein